MPYNLSGSYPKKPNSDLRMLYSVILKMLQGFPAFLPPFILLPLLVDEQRSSVHWGIVREEILGATFKYPGMS